MIRKLMVICLVGAICLVGTTLAFAEKKEFYSTLGEYEELTGKKIEEFQEAPMLRVKVAEGELPPVEERLPEEPLVIDPFEAIGKYGGILTEGIMSQHDWIPQIDAGREMMIMPDRAKSGGLVPNIAKDWEFSDEGKTFTVYLRKGMKWSDGYPFTADDILFMFEDVYGNKDIYQRYPGKWSPGGEPVRVEKIDDYTVSLHFATAYYYLPTMMAGHGSGGQAFFFLPKHALEKYHIKYNEDADKLAKENGYENWWQMFRTARYQPEIPTSEWLMKEIPTLRPWIIKKVAPTMVTWERNPYYWKIDAAGNQLPYIDECRGMILEGTEVYKMAAIAGQFDYGSRFFAGQISAYPLLRAGQEKGGYEAYLFGLDWSSAASLWVNQNYSEDPVLGEILRDVRFRQALSLSIDREELNEILFLGLGEPQQGTVVTSDVPGYEEEWARAYADYNPEEANRLLDEMGLDKRNEEGYRLRPDGEILSVTIMAHSETAICVYVGEMAKEYVERLGIKTTFQVLEVGHALQTVAANKHQITLQHLSASEWHKTSYQGSDVRGSWALATWASEWRKWFDTDGKEGDSEPPAWVKRLFTLLDSLPSLSKEERAQAITEIGRTQTEYLLNIGTVGLLKTPGFAKVNIGNFYPGHSLGYYNWDGDHRTYLWFWKK